VSGGNWEPRSEGFNGLLIRAANGEPKMAGKGYAVTHSDAEWRRILTPEQYLVMRSHGTEAPGSCADVSDRDRGDAKLRVRERFEGNPVK